jgi:uncharacterized membrane protein
MSLPPLWHRHPHVRSGSELTFGERSADKLKRTFGSWAFLGILNGFIVVWAALNWAGIVHFDPYPFIALNLVLSWLAAQQGGALQIAANRGDRISSEVAQHTYQNGQEILALNERQMEILQQQTEILTELRNLKKLLKEDT